MTCDCTPFVPGCGPCLWESWDTLADWMSLGGLHNGHEQNVSVGVPGGQLVVQWNPSNGGLNYQRSADIPRSIIESGMSISAPFGYTIPLDPDIDGAIQWELSLALPGGALFRRSAMAAVQADVTPPVTPETPDEVALRGGNGLYFAPISGGAWTASELALDNVEMGPGTNHVMTVRSSPAVSSASVAGVGLSGIDPTGAFNPANFYFIDGIEYGLVTVRASIDAVTNDAHTAWFGGISLRDMDGNDITSLCEDPCVDAGPTSNQPTPNQPVQDELVGTGNGVATVFTTDFPYIPGSLMVEVSGLLMEGVDDTNPATGSFTLQVAPATGAPIRATYRAVGS